MTTIDITGQLDAIASHDDFANRCYSLTGAWESAGLDIESVDLILRFMEEHPSVDFGAPGPLVHYAERFYGRGYEEKLLESIKRKPTTETIGMLNRLINGTQNMEMRLFLITEMDRARQNPLLDENTLREINRYLTRLVE